MKKMLFSAILMSYFGTFSFLAITNPCRDTLEFIQLAVNDADARRQFRENPSLLKALKELMTTSGLSEAEVNAMVKNGSAIFKESVDPGPSGRGEVFELFGGRIQLDITLTYKLIEQKKIYAPLVTKDISEYAESFFGLNRKQGWSVDTRKVENPIGGTRQISFGIVIDRSYAAEIPDDRLAQPGILLELEPGKFLIIDGNHRAARRYMNGELFMDFYRVSAEDLDKIAVK